MLGRRDVALLDAPIFLAGLFCAISPWVINGFAAAQPQLTTHNLIVGIAIGLVALGFTMAPERMYGMSWALCAIGLWLVVSAWVVGIDPTAGVMWTHIILGAVVFVLGLACMRQVMSHREQNGGEA
jgi:uncharacterized membrane protein YiaA